MPPPDTRQRILSTAERLFGEHGVSAVSLRQVGAEAGQKHNSATQYHFGDKRALVHAICDWRMAGIDRRRREMLADIEAGEADEIEKLVAVLVLPLAELLADPGGCNYVRLIGQLNRDPQWDFLADLDPHLTLGFRQVLAELDRVLRDRLPRRTRVARVRLLAEQSGDALSRRAAQQAQPGFDGPPLGSFVDELVNYMVAAIK